MAWKSRAVQMRGVCEMEEAEFSAGLGLEMLAGGDRNFGLRKRGSAR